MNNIAAFILFLFGFLPAFGQSSYVYFQNNTSLDLITSSVQNGAHIMSVGEWDAATGTINAWQLESELLRTNRESGVHNGTDFFFETYLISGLDTVTLQLQLNGNLIGSDIWHSAQGPGFNHAWQNDGDFYQETFMFNGKSVTLKYEAYFTGSYDDFLFVLHENEPYPVPAAELSQPQVFNVLAYNVFMLTPPTSTSDQRDRAKHIVDVCANYDAVLISEAFYNTAREDDLIPSMSTIFPYYTAVVDDAGSALEDGGVMIFSRWPILTEVDHVFQVCEGTDCLANKGVMYAEVDKLGQKYHLFATHTQAWTSSDEVMARLEQLRETRAFIDAQNIPGNEPIILGGDINVDALANHFNEYDSLYPIVNASIPTFIGYPYTYDPAANSYASGATEYLDYVLPIVDHISPISATNEPLILRSIHDDMWDIFDLSDHFAVHGRFEYAPLSSSPLIKPEVSVYPNPTTGKINFSVETKELSLFDLMGKLVLEEKGQQQLDLSNIPPGVYILQVTLEKKRFTYKIEKQ